MQDHDVPGPDQIAQSPASIFDHTLIGIPLSLAQRTAVPKMPVKKVVDPLGHAKKVRASPHNEPMGVDAAPSGVRHQRSQHLGDTAADRRRADRPQRPAREQLPGARLSVRQALPSSRPCRLAQTPNRHSSQRHLLERGGHPTLRSASAITAVPSPQLSEAANALPPGQGWDSGAEPSTVASRPSPQPMPGPGQQSSAHEMPETGDCRKAAR